MIRLSTICVLLAGFIVTCCSDFLDNSSANSTQTIFFEGGELSKSPLGPSFSARDLFFVNSKVGFIGGDVGTIYKTDDSGGHWQKKNSGTTLPIVSVMFLNEMTGFATSYALNNCAEPDCNKGSALLKTTDGGETWSKTFFKDYLAIFNLHFFDNQSGIAIVNLSVASGIEYKFARTSDGGATWTLLDMGIASRNEFQVVGSTVIVGGATQQLFRSDDRGITWQTIATPVLAIRDVRGIYFPNKEFGFMDDSTRVYRTVNGGANWETLDTPFLFLGVTHFWDANDGINIISNLNGSSKVYVTSNGGQSWSAVENSHLFSVMTGSFPASDVGYGINLSEFFTIRRR